MKIKLKKIRKFNLKIVLPSPRDFKQTLNYTFDDFTLEVTNKVKSQQTWDNNTISRNEPATTKFKQRKGYNTDSLRMVKDRFVNRKKWTRRFMGDRKIRIKYMSDVEKLYGYMGYWSKMKSKNYNKIIPSKTNRNDMKFFHNRLAFNFARVMKRRGIKVKGVSI